MIRGRRERGRRRGKKRQTNVRTTLRRQWGSRVPGAFNATHLGRISVVEAPIRDSALRGHFMPPIASDTGTLSTTPGNRPESFSDRKTTERRARFNLRARRSRGRRVSLLLVSQQSAPSSAARFNNREHDNDDELPRKPDPSPRCDKSYRGGK